MSNQQDFFRSGAAKSTAALLFFGLFTVVITFPVAGRLNDFSIFRYHSDAVLEAWTLAWDTHALLGGFEAIQGIWDANIFYPYAGSLAFSEHLLASAVLLMPATLLADAPMAANNLGILLTTLLTGWGTYLLLTWLTGNRWAGLVAGVAFTIAPYRLGHITQLHLISTHWIPFSLLAMGLLIKANQNRHLVLVILFTNLQFFSSVNYAPLVGLGLAIWTSFLLLAYRRQLSWALFGRLLAFALITLALNWPVLQLYRQVSDSMGVVRTLGDARIFGASWVNYVLPMGNSLLYGRWLGLPTHIDYQFPGIGIFVSTFPGIITLFLALAGLWLGLRSDNRRLKFATWAILLMTFVGFVLAFGANEAAFGQAWSAIVGPLLPYPYLYNVLSILQGLRVPIRFALLVTAGVAFLAGIGFSGLFGQQPKWSQLAGIVFIALITIEHLPAPLPGVDIPRSGPTEAWLASNMPAETILLALPSKEGEDLIREYQSTAHWLRLVNGASGFKPDGTAELEKAFDPFPSWQGFDLARQLGIDLLLLEQEHYAADTWDNILALLPAYLPAIAELHSLPDSLLIRLSKPVCNIESDIEIDTAEFPMLRLVNHAPATWTSNPKQVSRIESTAGQQSFLEPLFVLPGQQLQFELPLEANDQNWRVELPNLGQTITTNQLIAAASPPKPNQDIWQPLDIPFVNGAILQASAVSPTPRLCEVLSVGLKWQFASNQGEEIEVALIDQFGRVAISNVAHPVETQEGTISWHRLPLAETVPPGRYQLRVRLLTRDGQEIAPLGPDGAAVVQPLALPLVVKPLPVELPQPAASPSRFANDVLLLAVEKFPTVAQAGDWLRFDLLWRNENNTPADYTVFTQLLGPDGQVWGQHDNQPAGGWYPFSLWGQGETVVDAYAVRLDPAAPAGQYRLIMGLYNPTSGERVSIIDGPGAGGDFAEVGLITVEE